MAHVLAVSFGEIKKSNMFCGLLPVVQCGFLFFLFVALNMTSASSFQMLRGAVIIFTGLLSVAFLGRRLLPSQWLGILITILGLVIVGLADFFSGHQKDKHRTSDIITGEDFCRCALYFLVIKKKKCQKVFLWIIIWHFSVTL